jgi:hypothetical protein
MKKQIKCKLKTCLNCENGICKVDVPIIEKIVIPSSIKCDFFDNDMKKSYTEFKNSGGVLGHILRKKGKQTEEEIKETKKEIRKAKSDAKKKKNNK